MAIPQSPIVLVTFPWVLLSDRLPCRQLPVTIIQFPQVLVDFFNAEKLLESVREVQCTVSPCAMDLPVAEGRGHGPLSLHHQGFQEGC